MMTRTLTWSLVALMAFATNACGSGEENADQDATTTTDPSDSTDASDSSDPSDASDATSPSDPNCGGTYVSEITGKVTTPSGEGFADAKAQACIRTFGDETLLCLRPADTESSGDFSISVSENARCTKEITLRVVDPTLSAATIYCHPENATSPITTFETQLPLFPVTLRTSDADNTLSFDNGLSITYESSEFELGTGEAASAMSVKVSGDDLNKLCFLEDATVESAFFAGPEQDIKGDGWPVSVPNDLGLAAGETAKLWVLGGLNCKLADDTLVPEGSWYEVGSGVVSSDGSTINTVDGGHLPCLSWFGFSR